MVGERRVVCLTIHPEITVLRVNHGLAWRCCRWLVKTRGVVQVQVNAARWVMTQTP